MSGQKVQSGTVSSSIAEPNGSVSGKDSSKSFAPMTKAQFLAINDHYSAVLADIESNEELRSLYTECSMLLRKFCSNYNFQTKLFRKVKEYEAKIAVSKEENNALLKKLDEKNDFVEKQEEKMEELRQVAQQAVKERERFVREMESRKGITSKSADMSNAQKTILKLKMQLQIERSKIERISSEFNRELMDVKEEKNILSENLDVATATSKKLQEELTALKTEHVKETRKTNKALKEILILRSQVDAKDEELKNVLAEVSKLRQKIKSLETARAELEATCETYRGEVQALSSKLEDTRYEYEEQTQKFSDMLFQKEALATNLKITLEGNRNLTDEKGSLIKEKYSLAKRVSMLECCVNEAEEKAKLRAAEVGKLTKEIEMKEQQLTKSAKEIEEFRKQRDQVFDKVTKCDGQINQLQTTIKAKDEARIVLHEELLGTRSRLEKATKTIKDLEFERNVSLKKIQTLCDQLAEEKQKNKLLQEQNANYQKDVSDLNQSLKKERQLAKQMTEKKQQYNALYEAAQEQCEKERKANVDLNMYVARMKQINTELEVTNASLRANRRKVASINYSLKKAAKKQESEIKEMKSEIHAREQAISNFRKELRSKDEALDRTSRELEAVQRDKAALIAQLASKNKEIGFLNDKVNLTEQAMFRGKQDYRKSMEDLRLVQRELTQRYKQIASLSKKVKLCDDMKKGLIELQRDLTEEKLRTKALEAEMHRRINIHGWRTIKTNDPDKSQLITKNRILQGNVKRKTELLEAKDALLMAKEQLVKSLSSRQKRPDVETERLLLEYRSKCSKQKDKIASVTAQLNMYDVHFASFKSEIADLRKELSKYKEEENTRKRRERCS